MMGEFDNIKSRPPELNWDSYKAKIKQKLGQPLDEVEKSPSDEPELSWRDILRLGERLINKYLNYVIGNEERNPIPKMSLSNVSIWFFVIIAILIGALFI